MFFELVDLSTVIFLVIVIALVVGFRKSYHSSTPNEWMLVIRNGSLHQCGIGIHAFTYLGDQIVKFPSKINKVKFAAQQVTKEMQGLEVSGMILWSIFREKDGPFRAYKYLGDDLKQREPQTANENLAGMCSAIVRHHIANSTIEEVIMNRDLIRTTIKKSMSEITNGWGVWLESVEIIDVKILSGSLFSNLQTAFREEQRKKAEMILLNTNNEIKELTLEKGLQMHQKQEKSETEKKIVSLYEKLKQSEEAQKIFEKEQELYKKRAETEKNNKLVEKNINFEVKQRERELEEKLALMDNNLNKEKEKMKQELEKVEFEGDEAKKSNALALLKKEEEARNELKVQALQIEQNNFKEANFQIMLLNTIKDIYKTFPLQSMKVVNVMNGEGDIASKFISQIVTSTKEIMSSLQDKERKHF